VNEIVEDISIESMVSMD